ncbi:MAG: DUF6134 family protein [Pseudomonadota bacterium]
MSASTAFAAAGVRRFELSRGDEEVGFHTVEARETPDGLAVKINILIEVRRLGFRVYVYEHENNELWHDGLFMGLRSQTNDDGTDESCVVERVGDTLRIDGAGFKGEVPGDSVPTTYWNYANFQSQNWFSSQTGKPLNLKFRSRPEGPLERWDVTGDFDVTLIYDGANEWRGCRFDARGVPIIYRQSAPGAAFASLV